MKRTLLSGPDAEPLTLGEAKAHLRLETDDEDALIGSLVKAARIAAETETRRVLLAQGWRVEVETWSTGGIRLPFAPILAIDEVRWLDGDGVPAVLDGEAYRLDGETRLKLRERPAGAAGYEIELTAGYGTGPADVPEPIRQAIRLLVAHWYEHRSAAGDPLVPAPAGWRELIAPYRRLALC